DGRRLAWLEWDHPNMPWDGTELWVAELGHDGAVSDRQLVAGGPRESIWQPEWSLSGDLHYVSDRTGWWNLYRAPAEALASEAAEYGCPHWLFGGATYAFADDGGIVCVRVDRAQERLCKIVGGRAEPLALPYTAFGYPHVRVHGGRAVFVAASAAEAPAVVELDLASSSATVVRRSTDEPLDPQYVSHPEPIEFPTDGDRTAHAFFYPPRNPH